MPTQVKNSPPRVVISGYYGFQNAGDEAVLLSLLTTLRRLEPRLEATVLSNTPEETGRIYRVQAVNRWNPCKVLRGILGANLLISGGGSLLQDVTGLKSLLYYLGVIWLGLLSGRPVVIYAQGIGPLRTWTGRCLVGFTLRRVRAISVRDEASRAFLEEMGIRDTAERRVILAADPAWGLGRWLPGLGRASALEVLERAGLRGIDASGVQSPLVGFAVRDWLGLKSYKTVLGRMAAQLEADGRQVLYLPFKFPEDIKACREVYRESGGAGIVIKEHLTVTQLISLLGELELVIGLRLHALILAAAVGTPGVAVSYDPKVDALCRALELPNAGRVETLSLDVLQAEVNRVLRERAGYRQQLESLQPRLTREAMSSAYLVLDLLRNKR